MVYSENSDILRPKHDVRVYGREGIGVTSGNRVSRYVYFMFTHRVTSLIIIIIWAWVLS